jgi:hypothetical protein
VVGGSSKLRFKKRPVNTVHRYGIDIPKQLFYVSASLRDGPRAGCFSAILRDAA